ncbi:CCHC-type integrase [Gossypium australe]|uniref:CCHC-type integrase n=1 Tax=Gossypium australe TaxID=47621 RepID=A0A5B6VEW6_9ROSI|nr:CCHC-type integrase [Gossypium australe]
MTDLRAIFVCLSLFGDDGILAELQVKLSWLGEIKSKQMLDESLISRYILREAHSSYYSIDPGGNKMYCDLYDLYCWPGLKHKVTDFVSHFLTFQQVKVEHQLSSGLFQPVSLTPTKKDSVWVHTGFLHGFSSSA